MVKWLAFTGPTGEIALGVHVCCLFFLYVDANISVEIVLGNDLDANISVEIVLGIVLGTLLYHGYIMDH
jgi:hypothetical protein